MNDNINNEVENNNSTTSNSNQIFDLIQSIQSKLNSENDTNTKTEEQNDTNVDDNIQNDYNENSPKNTFDFSSILKNIDIGSIINTFNSINQNNSNNDINNNTASNNNFNGIDPSLIMKFGNMFSSATRNDPKKNLLLSLKPFLRKTRQDKLNEYITILTIVDAIGIFNSKGSDK